MNGLLEGSEKHLYRKVFLYEFPFAFMKAIAAPIVPLFAAARGIYPSLKGLVPNRMALLFLGWATGGPVALFGLLSSYWYDLAAGVGVVWICGLLLTATAVLNGIFSQP